ncbi:MAG: erythromycin resistance leader peptide [Heyndrickxia sp.]
MIHFMRLRFPTLNK